MRRRLLLALLCICCVFALVGAKRRAVGTGPRDIKLDAARSFAVTDPAVLAPFRFARVLNALVAGSSTTDEALFRQWWDTQNPKPGLDAGMPHCDDFFVNGQPAFNGFARRCPTPEGRLAREPYRPDDFIPIALVNRFDLADAGGAHCGQYRMIFARRMPGPEAFHIIFEGGLPNPRPERGLAGCRPVAQFWADLTGVESLEERRARLEAFFFDGIPGFAPAVHFDHYHRPPTGVRTLQHTSTPVAPNGTTRLTAAFFQFRVVRQCGTAGCRTIMMPDVLENQPHRTLFEVTNQSERAVRFREVFLQNVPTLAVPDVNLYFMTIPDEFLLGETQPAPPDEPFDFMRGYRTGSGTPAWKEFEERIQAKLRESNSTLTPEDIIRRAETQNCVGCHFLGFPIGNGVTFPAALPGLQHVTEDTLEGTSFAISAAMRNVFIPHRMQILKDFLLRGKPPVHSNGHGGGTGEH